MKLNNLFALMTMPLISSLLSLGIYSLASAEEEKEILYWVAPMDPDYRRDDPGKSPMGMDLVPVYANAADSRPGVVSIYNGRH